MQFFALFGYREVDELKTVKISMFLKLVILVVHIRMKCLLGDQKLVERKSNVCLKHKQLMCLSF